MRKRIIVEIEDVKPTFDPVPIRRALNNLVGELEQRLKKEIEIGLQELRQKGVLTKDAVAAFPVKEVVVRFVEDDEEHVWVTFYLKDPLWRVAVGPATIKCANMCSTTPPVACLEPHAYRNAELRAREGKWHLQCEYHPEAAVEGVEVLQAKVAIRRKISDSVTVELCADLVWQICRALRGIWVALVVEAAKEIAKPDVSQWTTELEISLKVPVVEAASDDTFSLSY